MGNEAAEKTEEATSRRRSKERERGNVAKSKDMESAMVMIGGLALLGVFWKHIYINIQIMMQYAFTNLNPAKISNSTTSSNRSICFTSLRTIANLIF